MRIIYVGKKDAYYAWANTRWACPREEIRILCVGRNANNIRGKKRRILCMGKPHGGNAYIFFPHILCVGRNAHNIRGKKRRILCMGKPHRGNAHIFPHTFYALEEMRIIYVKKKRILCMGKPHCGNAHIFFPQILCVGRNAHNIRVKKRRILCMGKPTMGMPT